MGLIDEVSDVLFSAWDPIDLKLMGGPRDEYRSFAPELISLVQMGGGEEQIAAHLAEIAKVEIGLSADPERTSRAASLIVNLVRSSA